MVRSPVGKGVPVSGFVFLLSIVWVMNRITEGRRTGIQWKLTSVLEGLDFADDIALLSSRYVDIKDKTSGLVDETARECLKINTKKSKVMRINTRNDQGIKVNDEQVDDVEEFWYPVALMDKEDGTAKFNCSKRWRAVLMYGFEAWKQTQRSWTLSNTNAWNAYWE